VLPQLLDLLPRGCDARGEFAESCVRVENGQVRQGIEQRLVFVLAVHLDQARGQVAKSGRRRQRPVDEGPAASLAGEFAADDDFLTGTLEDGFDGGVRLARPDQV
jgi:hypothetical protein